MILTVQGDLLTSLRLQAALPLAPTLHPLSTVRTHLGTCLPWLVAGLLHLGHFLNQTCTQVIHLFIHCAFNLG